MSDSLKRGIIFLSVLIILLFAVVFFKMNGNVSLTIPTVSNNSSVFCQEINTSGVYVLNQSILNENYSISPCFNVTSSDVELDCAGYSILNSSSELAIYAAYVSNVSVKNCLLQAAPSSYGIYFMGVNNSFITGNSVNSSSIGIYVYDSNIVEIKNNKADNNSLGIVVEKGSGNLLQNNAANLNSLKGILLNNTSGDSLINNSLSANGLGIYLYQSSNNLFSNNTAVGCSSEEGCISLIESSSNSFYNGNISTLAGSSVYIAGFNGINSSNNLFKDISLAGSSSSDINISSPGNTNNSLVNATYNSSKEFGYAGSELLRKWYYTLFVNSTARANGIANVNVTVYNSYNSFVLSNTTSSNGRTSLQTLTVYNNNGSRNYFTPYLITASNVSSLANHTINLSSNLLTDYLSFNITANTSNTTATTVSNSSTTSDEDTQVQQTTQIQAQTQDTTPEDTVNSQEVVYLSESQIEGGYSADLNVGESVYFNVSNEAHKLKVESFEINGEDYTINLTVSSDSVNFVLKMGEQKKLDFELDNYYDLLVGLDNITYDDKPLILIMRINESVVKEAANASSEAVTTSTSTDSINFGFLGSIEKKINSPFVGPVTPLHIILLVAILSLIIFIYAYVAGRKGNKNPHSKIQHKKLLRRN